MTLLASILAAALSLPALAQGGGEKPDLSIQSTRHQCRIIGDAFRDEISKLRGELDGEHDEEGVGRCWDWNGGDDDDDDDDGGGDPNSEWTVRQTENSNLDPDWVVVLRDGDPVPDLPGFGDQDSVEDYLEDYIDIDTGLIVLGPNSAIYLFELAAPNTSSQYFDLQDMVVLVTLGETPMAITPNFD